MSIADEHKEAWMSEGMAARTAEAMVKGIRKLEANFAGATALLRELRQSMHMQEQRESGEFHIPQSTALYLWRASTNAADEFISRIDVEKKDVTK